MKTFYYILILISIILSINNLNAQCRAVYSNSGKALYNQNSKMLNYSFKNAKQGGVLKLTSPNQFNDLNPFSLIGKTPPYYTMISFDSLFASPLDDINNLYPLIATHYCLDKNILDIHINSNAKWSNTDNITAIDIMTTLEYIKKINHPYYINLANSIDNMEIISNTQLRVVFFTTKAEKTALKQNTKIPPSVVSTNLLISLFTMPIMHHQDIQKLTLNLIKEPLHTSGYYIVDNYSHNKITLKKNQNYWGKNLLIKKNQANFDNIVITYLYNNKKELLAFNNNDIDIYNIKDLNNLSYYQTHYPKHFVKINKQTPPPLNALFFNTSKPIMQDKNLRKALILSFNSKIIHNQLQKEALMLQQYNHNAILASTLLDKTTYKYDDGIRKHTTTNEILNLNIVFTSTYEAQLYSTFLTNLNSLGIKTLVKILNTYQIQEVLKNNNFDIISGSYLYSNPVGEELYYYFFNYNTTQSHLNYNKLNDPIVNNLIMNIQANHDMKQHKVLVKKLYEHLKKLDIFIATYYYPYEFYLIKNHIQYQKSAFGLDIWSSYIK